MGHRCTCIFSRNPQAKKPFSPIAAKPNAPKHFLEEMGHLPHYPPTAHTSSNTINPHQPHAPTNLSDRNRNRTYFIALRAVFSS